MHKLKNICNIDSDTIVATWSSQETEWEKKEEEGIEEGIGLQQTSKQMSPEGQNINLSP